jgi:hypothetical protein
MTQPTPRPDDNRLKRHLEKGGKVTLDRRQTFTAPTVTLAAPQVAIIEFPGTDDLAKRLSGMGPDTQVRVNLDFAYSATPNFAVLAFLNTPKADADTSAEAPGFLGSIGFFNHDKVGESHGGTLIARLPATKAVKRIDRPGVITVTLAPVAFPDRSFAPHTVTVTATLDLVVSKVTKNS